MHMKKNLMIGVMVTLFTIASCNNYDEIRPTETISVAKERDNGITFTNEELRIWRDRAINGPYKTTGDRFARSPGSWDDVVIRANRFMDDKVSEYWDGDFISSDPKAYNYGHYILGCAFYYLIKEDITYGLKAKNAILSQISNPNPVWEDYLDLDGETAWGDSFHFAAFTNRMFMAFDYTYSLWTESEKEAYSAWMDRAIVYYWDASSHYPYLNFPNRDIGDYDTRSYWAAAGTDVWNTFPEYNRYTHFDKSGNPRNFMKRVNGGTAGYGNGQANFMLGYLLWGIYKNDTKIIRNAKGWVKECLMMSVFPDGMHSEALRNNELDGAGKETPAKGTMSYSIIVYETFFIMADALKRNYNDTELYDYATSNGYWGSKGGNKSLKLLLDTLEENCRGTVLRYYGPGQKYDKLLKSRSPNGWRHTPEMVFGIANRHYKSDKYKAIYLNEASGIIPYAPNDNYFDWVQDLSAWTGMSSTLPAIPLMYYEMENVIPTP